MINKLQRQGASLLTLRYNVMGKGADLSVANNNGWTPVKSAAGQGHLEVVKFLVEQGADLTVADDNGWTPVQSAAGNGHLEVVNFLVEKGADLTAASNNRLPPILTTAHKASTPPEQTMKCATTPFTKH